MFNQRVAAGLGRIKYRHTLGSKRGLDQGAVVGCPLSRYFT